ncbi:MAG: peptidase domain protein [Myxococcales bacterium]|nr:peptidase domain protein [Myxococcales bacterium]
MRALVLGFVIAAGCSSPAKPVTPLRPAPEPVATPVPAPLASDPLAQLTPLDPQIKLGHLKNGLTYYIMKHQKPERRASLWLAVNAGSVLEDEDQRGLAHFCEHMAFNGTKRFPKQAIVDYIEKVGMRFGADVNAYTSFDQTVYMLTVPTDDHGVLMKGFDILRDWAGDVSFDPVEVDKERGVVLEEWRLGRGAFARIEDKQFPVIFQGSRYGKRLPIGEPEILKTAKPDTLVRFYKDWYRPDQMAIIAVGDFDAEAIEKEITERFGTLVGPDKPRAREVIPVPHDQPPTVIATTDPEMPFSQVTIYDKLDHRPELTKGDYRRMLVEGIYHAMLRARLQELALDATSPFLSAGSGTTSFVRTSDLFFRSAQAKEGKLPETLSTLFREIARVERHGFLPSELERARKQTLSDAENSALEWAKTPDPDIADEITRHFFEHEQMGGRNTELAYDRELLPTITLDELDHLARNWGGEHGRVIAISGPAAAKLPTDSDVQSLIATSTALSIDPWKDDGADRPLMATKPTPGQVTATTHDDQADATVWTLSNGVRVVVKPTTFQNDEITFDGWQLGGSSLISDKDFVHARFAGDIVGASGAGDFDPIALRKVLAGKVVNVSTAFEELTQSVEGSARPADLESALQLLHLRLTSPRRDQRAFDQWKQEQLEWVRHKDLWPEVKFFDEMNAVESGDHLRRRPATETTIQQVDLDKALAIYRDRFSDFTGFSFVFVGNLDLEKLKPLVAIYLGSLPAKGRKEHWKDIGIKYPTTKITKSILAGTEPKSFVSLSMTAPDKWTLEGQRDAQILSMVLRIRMREVLREDMGGVYHVSVSAWLGREPTQRHGFSVFFGCDPANVDKLRSAVFDEVAKIAKDGIGPLYVEKVTEQLRRKHETDLEENRWWQSQLHDAYYFGDDFKAQTDVEAVEKRVTSANIKAAARRFFDTKNFVLGVMRPKLTASPAPVPSPGAARPQRTPSDRGSASQRP